MWGIAIIGDYIGLNKSHRAPNRSSRLKTESMVPDGSLALARNTGINESPHRLRLKLPLHADCDS